MAEGNDSSGMTIEFLRARLLSERSVSRSARQRADQLAKRVSDLEEQLRIVTIQRKKAERAATEVLIILENQGIGNFCEVVDSSSDKDENGGVLVLTSGGGNVAEEDNSSGASGMQNRSEVDDGCSGSEVEVSPSQGKNLSWKGSRNGSESLERKKIIQTRQGMRRRAFIYSPDFSSSKRQLGKSCRKLKRSDSVDMAANGKDANDPLIMEVQKSDDLNANDESAGRVLDQQDTCNGNSKHNEDKLGFSSSAGDQNKFFDSNFYVSGVDKEEEMELALEKQAQLIDLYQAEEDAQREWEEKFNENHSKMGSSQWVKNPAMVDGEYVLMETAGNDSVSHGEGNSTKQTTSAVQPNATTSEMVLPGTSTRRGCSSNEQKALAACHGFDMPEANTNCSGHTPNGETSGLVGQKCAGSTNFESEDVSKEFEFPGLAAYNGRSMTECFQEPVNNCSNGDSDRSLNLRSQVSESVGKHSENISSLKSFKEQLSETQIQLHHLSSQAHDSSLEVLGSLQRAKLSLSRQLNRVQQPTSKTWEAAVDLQALAVQQKVPAKGLNVPIGSASLFRLPTDPLPSSNLLGSTDIKSSLDIGRHYSDLGFTTNSGRYPETILRTHTRSQDYDYRFTSGNRSPPVDATRYSYPILHSYPTSNISSTGPQIPHMGIHRDLSQNPYFIHKIDGVGPSWRIQ